MEIRTNEPMARHTSFRVGGPADRFVIPESETELREAVLDCKKSGRPWYMIGNGSNLLVGDKGFRGTIISTERLAELEVQKNENIIIAGAGVMLSKLANTAAREELTGLEFAAGIPGTVGGAVMMNAGAYGSEMKNVLLWADVMDQDGNVKLMKNEELELGYRTSCLERLGLFTVRAAFKLTPGDPEVIRSQMEELARKRKEKQPLEYPSAGSTLKGIELEREKLAFLKKEADQVIDTSRLLTKELRHELENLYSEADGRSSMFITVVSFGFKYGIPADADLVFDVRFLPNPYYVEELRFHTGTEQAVQDYVMQGGTGEEFLKKLNDLLEFVIPKYEQEGKTQLVIAIGCTGGRHRSVTIAGEVFKRLTESGRYEIRLEHRDAGKDGGK